MSGRSAAVRAATALITAMAIVAHNLLQDLYVNHLDIRLQTVVTVHLETSHRALHSIFQTYQQLIRPQMCSAL